MKNLTQNTENKQVTELTNKNTMKNLEQEKRATIEALKQDMFAAHAFGDKEAAKEYWLMMVKLQNTLPENIAAVKREAAELNKLMAKHS